MPQIKLRTADDVIFETERRVVRCSRTILTELGSDGKDVCVPLPNIDASNLRKILEWAEHHKEDYDNLIDYETSEMTEWDAAFMPAKISEIIELFSAAIYLDIKALIDLCCRQIALKIQGQTMEQMRVTLNINPEGDKEIK
ncbi:S-phase kinase-associated protein 1-like [Drosophila obscura]|uniref:S-phase kinase-associated protein 1-like n=1 Tax=Drosophila obscura TaxID=7282 RepID=UPI001BB15337|nr:S-phase kinase-associated protein 1-like [Drosophila obscura]